MGGAVVRWHAECKGPVLDADRMHTEGVATQSAALKITDGSLSFPVADSSRNYGSQLGCANMRHADSDAAPPPTNNGEGAGILNGKDGNDKAECKTSRKLSNKPGVGCHSLGGIFHCSAGQNPIHCIAPREQCCFAFHIAWHKRWQNHGIFQGSRKAPSKCFCAGVSAEFSGPTLH